MSLTMSTTQSRLNFWHHLALKTRFAHARLKKGTVRFKTSNLASVYAAYEERGIAYVVLRWAAEVPMEQFEEVGYTKDVDHLIAAKDVIAALDVSSAYPGKIKCDYYSAEGRSGTSYNGMPYYQPERALSILARRSRDPRGFYRPCLEDEFFRFCLSPLLSQRTSCRHSDRHRRCPRHPRSTRLSGRIETARNQGAAQRSSRKKSRYWACITIWYGTNGGCLTT